MSYGEHNGRAKVGTKQFSVQFKPKRGNQNFLSKASIRPQYTHLVDCQMVETSGPLETLEVLFTHLKVVLHGVNLETLQKRIADHLEPVVLEEELGANGNQFVDIDKAVVTGMELMGPPE